MRSTRRGKINVNLISFASILVMVAWVLLFIPNASGEVVKTDDKEKDKYKKGELIVKFKPSVPEEVKDKIHLKYDSKKLKKFLSINIDYVKLKDLLGVEEAIALYLENPEVEFAEPNFLFKILTPRMIPTSITCGGSIMMDRVAEHPGQISISSRHGISLKGIAM